MGLWNYSANVKLWRLRIDPAKAKWMGLFVVGDGIFRVVIDAKDIFVRGSLQRYVSQKSNKKRRQIR